MTLTTGNHSTYAVLSYVVECGPGPNDTLEWYMVRASLCSVTETTEHLVTLEFTISHIRADEAGCSPISCRPESADGNGKIPGHVCLTRVVTDAEICWLIPPDTVRPSVHAMDCFRLTEKLGKTVVAENEMEGAFHPTKHSDSDTNGYSNSTKHTEYSSDSPDSDSPKIKDTKCPETVH